MGLHQRSPLDYLLTFHGIQPKKLIKMPKGSGLTKPMKLSADLAEVVGKKEASRAECIKQLWAYIKKNNLQDPENKQFFNPDKKMAKVFGTDRIRAFGMAKFLSAHLSSEVTRQEYSTSGTDKKKSCAKGGPERKKRRKYHYNYPTFTMTVLSLLRT